MHIHKYEIVQRYADHPNFSAYKCVKCGRETMRDSFVFWPIVLGVVAFIGLTAFAVWMTGF